MGVNEWTDGLGRILGMARSYEWVAALGWGFNFHEIGIENHYFGITAKFVNSVLAPGIGPHGQGTGNTFAIDAGYLWTLGYGFRFGATFMNMGPSVYYIDPEYRDPIPFTINLALALKNDLYDLDLPIRFAGELRLEREVVKNYPDRKPDPFYRAIWTDLLHDKDESPAYEFQQINWHIGGEITALNTFSVRNGILFDWIGERYEWHFGFGLHFLNHYSLDCYYIYAPEGFMRGFVESLDRNKTGASGARYGQYGLSLTLTRVLNQSDEDMNWQSIRP